LLLVTRLRAAVAADGHAYVFPVPTTGGASSQQQFVLFTQQQYLLELIVRVTQLPILCSLDNSVKQQLCVQSTNRLTLNVGTDFVVKATGTA